MEEKSSLQSQDLKMNSNIKFFQDQIIWALLAIFIVV